MRNWIKKVFSYLTGMTSGWQEGWEKQTAEMIEAVNNKHAGKGTFSSGFRLKEIEKLHTRRNNDFEEQKRQRVITALAQWVPITISLLALIISLVALFRT